MHRKIASIYFDKIDLNEYNIQGISFGNCQDYNLCKFEPPGSVVLHEAI